MARRHMLLQFFCFYPQSMDLLRSLMCLGEGSLVRSYLRIESKICSEINDVHHYHHFHHYRIVKSSFVLLF